MAASGDADPIASDAGISSRRLEGLSDGIMAVAITLLVLNVEPPERATGESLWQALDAQVLGEVGVFLLSFLLIARYWLVHHRVFAFLPSRCSPRFVAVNFAFLATICLMPFTTEIFTANSDDVTALAVYAGGLALGSALLGAMFRLAGRPGGRRSLLVPFVFLAAIPVGLVIGPQFAPLTWFLLALVPEERRRPAPR